MVRLTSGLELTTGTPYLALMAELGAVCWEHFGGNWQVWWRDCTVAMVGDIKKNHLAHGDCTVAMVGDIKKNHLAHGDCTVAMVGDIKKNHLAHGDCNVAMVGDIKKNHLAHGDCTVAMVGDIKKNHLAHGDQELRYSAVWGSWLSGQRCRKCLCYNYPDWLCRWGEIHWGCHGDSCCSVVIAEGTNIPRLSLSTADNQEYWSNPTSKWCEVVLWSTDAVKWLTLWLLFLVRFMLPWEQCAVIWCPVAQRALPAILVTSSCLSRLLWASIH